MKVILIIVNLLGIALAGAWHPIFHTVDNHTRGRMVVDLKQSGQIDTNDFSKYWYGFNVGETPTPTPDTILYQSRKESFVASVTIPAMLFCAINLLLIGTFWPSRTNLQPTDSKRRPKGRS